MTPISAVGIGLVIIALILAYAVLASTPVYNNSIEGRDWSPNSNHKEDHDVTR